MSKSRIHDPGSLSFVCLCLGKSSIGVEDLLWSDPTGVHLRSRLRLLILNNSQTKHSLRARAKYVCDRVTVEESFRQSLQSRFLWLPFCNSLNGFPILYLFGSRS